jgi:hypothetical protein
MVIYPTVHVLERVGAHEVYDVVLCATAADEHAIFGLFAVSGFDEAAIPMRLPEMLVNRLFSTLSGVQLLLECLDWLLS